MLVEIATSATLVAWAWDHGGPCTMKQPFPWMEIGANKKTYDFPSSKNPILRLNESICNSPENCLEAGDYETTLSGDKKFLVLLQQNEVKAKIPVYKLVETTEKKLIPTAEKIDQKNGYFYFIYEYGDIKAVGIVKNRN